MNLGSLKFIIFLLAPAFDSMVMCLRFFYLLLKSFDEYNEIVFVFCKYDKLAVQFHFCLLIMIHKFLPLEMSVQRLEQPALVR